MSGDGGRAAGARVNFAQVSLRLSMSRPPPNRPPPARLPATTLIPRRHLLSAAAAAHCLQLFALFKTVVARRDPSLSHTKERHPNCSVIRFIFFDSVPSSRSSRDRMCTCAHPAASSAAAALFLRVNVSARACRRVRKLKSRTNRDVLSMDESKQR